MEATRRLVISQPEKRKKDQSRLSTPTQCAEDGQDDERADEGATPSFEQLLGLIEIFLVPEKDLVRRNRNRFDESDNLNLLAFSGIDAYRHPAFLVLGEEPHRLTIMDTSKLPEGHAGRTEHSQLNDFGPAVPVPAIHSQPEPEGRSGCRLAG